ncbi:MAG: Gfo/Idh/MocA family protein [Candidatus Zipacnadales bacterium]
MADRIRCGIIGTGMIGKTHINRYKEVAEAEVIAVCDIREEEAQRVAQTNNIPYVFTNYKELLKLEEIDVVDVCLPNALHCPVTCDALKAGKHVYCEKPMANSAAEARKMLRTAQETGKTLAIQLGTLFSGEAHAAKRVIDAGLLGRIYFAKSSYYRRRGRCYVDGYATPPFVQKEVAGGGALADMGVYHLGLMVWLLGNPDVLTVSASTFQEIPMDQKRAQESGYNVEEFATGFVRFAGDITLFFEEAWATHMEGEGEGFRVFGSHGGLRVQPFGFFTDIADMQADVSFNVGMYESRQSLYYGDAHKALRHQQMNLVWALLGRVPLLETAPIACKVAEITEAMYRSAKMGREIKLPQK